MLSSWLLASQSSLSMEFILKGVGEGRGQSGESLRDQNAMLLLASARTIAIDYKGIWLSSFGCSDCR